MSFGKIWGSFGGFLKGLGVLSGLSTALMTILVVCNVFSRYVLNKPIDGAFEISQSLLTILVFFSLALAEHQEANIRVVLLIRHLPRKGKCVVSCVTSLLSLVFSLWCSFATWNFAMESYHTNELEWGTIQYPLYPVKFVVFFGLALLSFQYALGSVKQFRESLSK